MASAVPLSTSLSLAATAVSAAERAPTPAVVSTDRVSNLAKSKLDQPVIPFSGAALGAMAQIADTTYFVRTFADLASSFSSCPDGLKPLADSNVVSFYQTQGITTGLNFFWGICYALPTIKALQEAQKLGDKEGETQAIISLARDACMAAGGLSFLAYRPLALASTFTGAPAASFTGPSLLGNATYGMGMIGVALFGAFYGLLAYQSCEGFVEPDAFLTELDQAVDKRAFLQGKLQPSQAEIDEIDLCSIVELGKMYKQEVQAGAEELLALFKESGRTDVPQTIEDCTELYKSILQREFPIGSETEATYLRLRAKQKLYLIKEMSLTRLLGPELVSRIKNLPADNEATDAVVTSIQQKLTTSSNLSKAEFVIYALGFIATILFFVTLTGGWGAVVVAALFIVIALGMACTDGFRLYQAIESGKVAEGDTKLIIASMAVLTAVTIAALCLACIVFPPAIVPLLVILLSYAATMSLNAVTLYHVYQAQNTDAYKKNLELQEQLKKARLIELNKFCDTIVAQKQAMS